MKEELSEGDRQFMEAIKALKVSPTKNRIIEAREKYGGEITTKIVDISYQEKIAYWKKEVENEQKGEDFKKGYKTLYFFNKRNEAAAKLNIITLRKYGLDGLLKIL